MTKKKIKHNPHAREIARKFEHLVDVMFTLRSEGGCPWDRAQSLQDLKQYLMEETYELLQTLDQLDDAGMKEELGDLLFQIVFLSQMMQETGSFTLLEVITQLIDKMIGRHPHVFGDAAAKDPNEALENWESMKSREKAAKEGVERSILKGIPLHLPALLQAHRISDKVTRVGFEWETEQDVWKKLAEEIGEFQAASSKEAKEEEFGDILFTLVNIARKNGINAEDSLRAANEKFRRRFMALEKQVYSQNKDLSDLTLREMDQIWDEVKKTFTLNGEKT